MDRDLELAEMVVNGEIDLEEAKQLTTDVNRLLECIKIRKSMKYAMKSMIYWNQMIALSKDITSLACSMNAYKGWVKRYAESANRLLERHRQLEERQLQDAYWRWGEEWAIEDVEYALNSQSAELEELLEKSHEALERNKEAEESIEERKRAIESCRKLSKNYAIGSIVQVIGEILDTLGMALLS